VFPEILKEKANYFAGVAGRTHHLDGSATPPETATVFEKFALKTFAKRFDYAKTAGTRDAILAQYREFLDAVPKGKPFVLQLCFSDPHRPLDKNAIPQPHDPAKLKLPPFYPDTKLVREDFARYYDEISRFDADVGTVLAELKKRGLTDNTLIVVSADNGASQFRGKGTLNEFGIHCPLVVRMPGGRGKVAESLKQLISGEDLAPTFLAAAGLNAPKEMTGRSFLPLLKGEKGEAREYVFAQRGAHGSGLPQNSAAFDLGRCVVGEKHKLIYNALWQIPYWPVDFAGDEMWKELVQMNKDGKLAPELSKLYFSPTRPMFELYDLDADPNELKNLVADPAHAKALEDLRARLADWRERTNDPWLVKEKHE
jgi:arylsulfatase A-like enzyme